MTKARIHGSSIATQRLRILSDYAYLSEDSNFSRGNRQIPREEIKNTHRDIWQFIRRD